MSITVNDLLKDVSLALYEDIVNTTLGTTIASGSQTVTPASMVGIYYGAMLIIGGTTEVVTVTAVTATTFTATFANAHASTDSVTGCTFPTGQTSNPLFTQAEMIGYLEAAQNDFLLATAILYNQTTDTLNTSQRFLTQPTDCIRMERISISGQELLNTTTADLDMEDPEWMTKTAAAPTHWFQDMTQDFTKIGFKKLPAVGNTVSLWYSKRVATALTLTTALAVPDVFAHFLKYYVLGHAYEKDGEMRDPARAKYCMKRFEFGIVLAVTFMMGVGAAYPGQAPQKFSGLEVG